MKNKYMFVLVLLLSILVLSFGFTNIYVSHHQQTEDEGFVVVTSFYPMYIASMNVIGETEGVTLKNLSEPQTGCLHDFQLTPADMKLLSTADVFIINGGGIESFMEEIAKQYPDLVIIEACEGIELLCEEGAHGEEDSHEHEAGYRDSEDAHEDHNHDVNAHAWMSVALHRKQVENIGNGLAAADQAHAQSYLSNAAVYDEKLAVLQEEQESLFPMTAGQEVIMFHCAYDYVAKDLGLDVAYCMDLDEERQISAGEVAEVLSVIETHQVKYIFAEELYGASMCETVKGEAKVEVLYLDPLNRGEYNANSYIDGMTKNISLLKSLFAN